MKTPVNSMILFLVAAGLGAVGQFLYKAGAERLDGTVIAIFNWRLLVGVLCYVAVMVLFVAAFKLGGQLTVLYPLYATTFIWTAVIALLAEGTPIKLVHILGMALLIVGMYLMGW